MIKIYLLLLTFFLLARTQQLDITIDTNSGAYTLLVQNQPWLRSGDYGIRFNNDWYSTVDGKLQIKSTTTNQGTDILGKYSETVLQWSAGTNTWITSFKNYSPQPFIIFTQSFPNSFSGTSSGNNNDVITAFPTFKLETSPLHYLTYFGTFADAKTGQWGVGTNYPHGIQGGVPLALFDSNLVTMMISPFDNFMVGIQTLSTQFKDQLACGIQGKIMSIPAGYTHTTIISLSKGVSAAHMYWGGLLSKFYGKSPKTPDDDFSIKYLGYWTDNGAYYYYHTEQGKNYAETMIDVANYIQSIDLPVKYYQFDSWWYFKGRTSGLVLWEPMPEIFPDGMKAVVEKLGTTKIVLHNRWFENDTDYYTKMSYPFISEPKTGYALPLTIDPYIYFMTKAKDWGLIVYEQDWLVDQFLNMEATQVNVSTAINWLTNMNQAASQLGLTIQMCMPLPSHILQSIKMNTVTQIRASGDYQRQIYDKNQWAIGYTSILHHSLGVFPFKDCFWSNNVTQPDCVAKVCVEPNALLETLSSALSTGPVAPADKIGFISKENLMQTCRKDGLLLKPDVPAMTMDVAFTAGFTNTQLLYNISHTYSQHILHDGLNNPTLNFHYLLIADTEIPFTLFPRDFGESDNDEFLLMNYFERPTVLSRFGKGIPLSIPPLIPNGDLVTFRYYVILPVLNGYSLIGERDKFAVASKQRFTLLSKSTSPTQSVTKIELSGTSGEVVNIEMVHVPSRKIEPYSCTVNSGGTSVLTCLEAGTMHSCTC